MVKFVFTRIAILICLFAVLLFISNISYDPNRIDTESIFVEGFFIMALIFPMGILLLVVDATRLSIKGDKKGLWISLGMLMTLVFLMLLMISRFIV